jgi:hypothetical protein
MSIEEQPKMRSFNLLVINAQQNSVFTHWISTTQDLVQKFKEARMEENRWLVWEKGLLRVDAILGIMEN